MSDKTVLRLEHAHKYYERGRAGEIHVMNDITLALPERGLVAFFGKSGCGKTTLLNTVGGLDGIASGRIEIFGTDIATDPDVIRNRYIGYIFQNYNLNTSETVFENVADALRLCGVRESETIRTRVMAALCDVGMEKYRDRTPDTLSGGQQQRVAIARAIVKSPAIILADEPTGNLDENNTVLVMDILKEISRTRLVLLVTHEANLVDFYCDRVIEMADGKIIGERENAGAEGYIQRNKNDIYLGDLTEHTTELSGVRLTTYGDLPEGHEVKLRLVSEGGRLFLTCDTPGVRFLDETSEIHLREGSFQPAADPIKANRNGRPSEMAALPPVEGEHFGRLYHFGNALTMAWRENFGRKAERADGKAVVGKRKRGKGFLRVCLVMLAFVMVFTAASSAVQLKRYIQYRENYSENLFYLPLYVDDDGKTDYDYNRILSDSLGENGIDGLWITSNRPAYMSDSISFRTAGFMTAQDEPTLSAEAVMMPYSTAKDWEVVYGTGDLGSTRDLLITTATADDLLASSSASYIRGYDDLIGLTLIENVDYYAETTTESRIAGIVRSEEKAYILSDMAVAQKVLSEDCYLPLTALSLQSDYTGTLARGEIAVIGGGSEFKVGETISLCGRDFTVREVQDGWNHPNQYPEYVASLDGGELLSFDDWKTTQSGYDDFQLTCRYIFEYYPCYLQDFLKAGGTGGDDMLLLYRETGEMSAYFTFLTQQSFTGLKLDTYMQVANLDANLLWGAWTAYQYTDKWPSAKEAYNYADDYEVWSDQAWMLWKEYGGIYDYGSGGWQFVVCDEDYIQLSGSAGATDDRTGSNVFDKWLYGNSSDMDAYYNQYMVIHSSDSSATTAYLRGATGTTLVTLEDILDEIAGTALDSFVTAGITLTVLLAFMCLCVFFIMRSSFMSRVREVGILRAIGVSKKNLLYRFFIETLLLTLLTVCVGFLLAAFVANYLSGGAILDQILYFPPWLAAGMLSVIMVACLFFGLLPAMLLLRKTPSEILSKYDI